MTTQANEALSDTLNPLLAHSPDALLDAFIYHHNTTVESVGDLQLALKLSDQRADGLSRLNDDRLSQIDTLSRELATVNAENATCRQMALDAEKIANKSLATDRELKKLQTAHRELQQAHTKLKSGGSPDKLREQLANAKTNAREKQKRIDMLVKQMGDGSKELKAMQLKCNEAVVVIRNLKKQLAHDTGSGLYHKDDHHLIVWPQTVTMQREDGSTFAGRSLLYMHQSGRGGLVSYDPESGTHLSAAPKSGLRPTTDLLNFANDWLYKVNILQDGIPNDDDMAPIDYNTGSDY